VKRRAIAVRDQHASAFGAALLRLCDSTGAVGAALVDAEGETVDYAGSLSPFDIKVAAAECVILLALLREAKTAPMRETQGLLVRAANKSFFVQSLADGYAIVLELLRHAFGVSPRAVQEAVRELCGEAGLAVPAALESQKERWCRVDVRCDDVSPKRPRAIWLAGGWTPLEVLGRWTAGLGSREIGFRARLANGAELTLVREPLGRWYSDAALPQG
jgi:hypothetical protein